MEQRVENSGKSSLGRRLKRLSLKPLVSPVDSSSDVRKTADMSSSPSSCPNSPISPVTPMSASFSPIGQSVPHIASASISPIYSREEIPPPTSNCMGPRQKNKLLKTTRKLYRILGSTPVLSDCEDSVLDSSCHSRSLSGWNASPEHGVRRQDSSASCVSRRSKRPFYFPLSPRPSLASLRPLSPPILKVDCSVVGNLQRHSSMASSSTRISVPQPSSAHSDDSATIVLDTPKHRRNKMAKLARYLGENIPIELVFPVPRFSPSTQLESPSESPVETDAAEALQERFRSSLGDDHPRRKSESSRTDQSGSECTGELRRTQTMGIGRTRQTSQPISPLFDAPLQALQFGHNPSGLEENTDVMQVYFISSSPCE
ncbi:hypothetical protein BD410DRAFT_455550 [Rickenella mellea]|uniref:Uncharacterized protein n=1 Tax=Rickenella mellea TaxID=50990 RepID=A0A4Y7PVG0_9AGAM|nr:hypothetical protein BD410DRAFT_455550 [Rickenella mellea]